MQETFSRRLDILFQVVQVLVMGMLAPNVENGGDKVAKQLQLLQEMIFPADKKRREESDKRKADLLRSVQRDTYTVEELFSDRE